MWTNPSNYSQDSTSFQKLESISTFHGYKTHGKFGNDPGKVTTMRSFNKQEIEKWKERERREKWGNI